MTSDLTLHLDRQIDARPETVWRCMTDPDLLVQWFAPKPVIVSNVKLDLRPGGIFSLQMQMPGHDPMDAGPDGCVLLVVPNERLVWTAALGPDFAPNPPHTNPDDFYMTADMRLTPKNGGTLYTVRALHSTPVAMSAHEKMGFHGGWGTAAGQLEELATSQERQ